jgi:hypothetical protein
VVSDRNRVDRPGGQRPLRRCVGVEVSKSVTSITETLVVELWSLTRSSGLLAVVSTVTNVPRDPEELRAMYENGNHEWRRAFIESMVEEIVIGPGCAV